MVLQAADEIDRISVLRRCIEVLTTRADYRARPLYRYVCARDIPLETSLSSAALYRILSNGGRGLILTFYVFYSLKLFISVRIGRMQALTASTGVDILARRIKSGFSLICSIWLGSMMYRNICRSSPTDVRKQRILDCLNGYLVREGSGQHLPVSAVRDVLLAARLSKLLDVG